MIRGGHPEVIRNLPQLCPFSRGAPVTSRRISGNYRSTPQKTAYLRLNLSLRYQLYIETFSKPSHGVKISAIKVVSSAVDEAFERTHEAFAVACFRRSFHGRRAEPLRERTKQQMKAQLKQSRMALAMPLAGIRQSSGNGVCSGYLCHHRSPRGEVSVPGRSNVRIRASQAACTGNGLNHRVNRES